MHDVSMKVGFIGLGEMGMPMLQHLSKAGMPTIAFDFDASAAEAATRLAHVTVAQSVANVAGRCHVLFTCLPTLQSIRDVYLGEMGIGANAIDGLITCECSTITPDLAVELQAAMSAHGVHHLDTPVFGTPQHAQAGDLYFLVSGEAESAAKVEPFFRAMGKRYRYVGETGNANRIKLIQNALGCVNAVATAEALAMCKLTGIDLLTFVTVVKECDGIGNSTYFDRYAESVARGEDGGAGRLLIAAKDMQLLGEIAAQAEVDAPLMKHTEQAYAAARESGLGSAEFTEVARVIEARIGKRLFYDTKTHG